VRGRTEPVRLYELMLAEDYPHLDWLPEFTRAYQLFRADQRTQARTLFKTLAETYNDPVSRYYFERCQTARNARRLSALPVHGQGLDWTAKFELP